MNLFNNKSNNKMYDISCFLLSTILVICKSRDFIRAYIDLRQFPTTLFYGNKSFIKVTKINCFIQLQCILSKNAKKYISDGSSPFIACQRQGTPVMMSYKFHMQNFVLLERYSSFSKLRS